MQRVKVSSEFFFLFVICLFDLLFLLYYIKNISISYHEADIFYHSFKISGILSRFFVSIFGQNDYILRLPFLILHILNVIFLYKISKFIIKRKFDRIVSVLIFILLPSVMASAILVNDAGVIMFFVLLSIYFYKNGNLNFFYATLFILPFISGSFLIYFLSIFAFGIYKKDAKLSWIAGLLCCACFYFYGFEASGKPRGYFLDTISIFAISFSPFIFIYFVYTIYRIWIKKSKDLLWFVCMISFLLCLVLSIRQKPVLEDFLPFCVLVTPLMVRSFFSSYRVRLPVFRRSYKILAAFSVAPLIVGFCALLLSDQIYKFISDPTIHFAYKYGVVKELACELKGQNINKISTSDERLALRLKFYGIENSLNAPKLIQIDDLNGGNLTLKKVGVTIARFDLQR
ncbi:MAG: hypothetical protein ACTTJC_08730 [Campylobacter sp.]